LLGSDYEILALSETWLNSSILNSELFTDEYTVFRRDRCADTGMLRGGGVLLAVKNHIKAKRLFRLETEGENIWLKIQLNSKFSFICAIVYFPPNSPLQTYINFFDKINIFTFTNEHLLILGDFNLPITGIEYEMANGNNICKQLLFFMELYGLKSMNDVKNFQGRTLDLVLTDININVFQDVSPLVNIDIYHPAINICFDIQGKLDTLNKDNEAASYNYRAADFLSLYHELRVTCWNDLLLINNIEEAVTLFYSRLYNALNFHVPIRKIHKNKFPIWYSNDLKHMIKRKEKIRRSYIKHQMPLLFTEYKNIRAEVKRLIRLEYKEYLKSVESGINRDPKSFWGVVKGLRGGNKKSATMLYEGREVEGGRYS